MSPLLKLGDIDFNENKDKIADYVRENHHLRTENYLNKFYMELGIH